LRAEHKKNAIQRILWGFVKLGLTRLLAFFLAICRSLIGFGVGYFWTCISFALPFLFCKLKALCILVNDWISNRPYEVPHPTLGAFGGALLFNVYRAQRQERIG
jgi:two-component system phosphate regulon sensor histidine kinase PhoR